MAKLIGAGVGPGDPELLSIKVWKLLQNANIIMVPGTEVSSSVAYQTASQIVDLSKKDVRCFDMPMTKDKEVLKKAHETAIKQFIDLLDEGEDILCLTLGDPSIYSTYMYLHEKIADLGYETQIIPGIPSFCAAAAALGTRLCSGKEQLHIIPASYDIDAALRLSGTKVLMKSASKIKEVKEKLSDKKVYMVENCGMSNERRYTDASQIPDSTGYFSLLIVRE